MKVLSKLVVVVIVILMLCSAGLYLRIKDYTTPTKGEIIQTYDRTKSALLVIDIQKDFTGKTAKAPFPYKNSDTLINKVNYVIDNAVKHQMPVIYISQIFENSLIDLPLSKGRVLRRTPGAELDPRVKVVSHNKFLKRKSDAFSNSEFESYLIKNRINQLYLVGLDATACVYKTARGAINRDYKVTIIQDGIATMNAQKINDIIETYKKCGISIIQSSEFEKAN